MAKVGKNSLLQTVGHAEETRAPAIEQIAARAAKVSTSYLERGWVKRGVFVPSDVWDDAMHKAKRSAEKSDMSELVTRLLREYLRT